MIPYLQCKCSFPIIEKPTSVNGATKPAAAAVWSLDSADMLDDDLELINDDELLDDDDLKKPDPASLRGELEKNIPTYNIYMKLL